MAGESYRLSGMFMGGMAGCPGVCPAGPCPLGTFSGMFMGGIGEGGKVRPALLSPPFCGSILLIAA